MQTPLTITEYKQRMAALAQQQQNLFNQIPPFGIADNQDALRIQIQAEIFALQGQRP
jgi:hypothetical protein